MIINRLNRLQIQSPKCVATKEYLIFVIPNCANLSIETCKPKRTTHVRVDVKINVVEVYFIHINIDKDNAIK